MSNPYDQNPEPNPYGQNPYGQNPADPNQGGAPYGQNPYGQNPADPNQGVAPYGQNPYAGGYPAGGYGAVGPQPHPQGTTVLVLGIIGLVVCAIAGIVALVMGNKALKEIDANPGAYNNRQNVVIGRILGIVGIVIQGLVVVGYAIVLILAIANSGTTG
jgi:hypothetical protein